MKETNAGGRSDRRGKVFGASTSHEAGRARVVRKMKRPARCPISTGKSECTIRNTGGVPHVRSRTPDSCVSGSSCSIVQWVHREAGESQQQSGTAG